MLSHLMWLPLKITQKLCLVQHAHIILLLYKLMGIQVKFNVLLITSKAHDGIEPGYLGNSLFYIISASPVISGRVGALKVLSIKQCLLSEFRQDAFSVVVTTLWNRIASRIHIGLTLVIFKVFFKNLNVLQCFGTGWLPRL